MQSYRLIISVVASVMCILSINQIAHAAETDPTIAWVYRDKIRMRYLEIGRAHV